MENVRYVYVIMFAGHFALLMTTSEAREKVIEYMPIMSQPLVLLGERPVSWTPVYADLAVSFSLLQSCMSREIESCEILFSNPFMF